jgi:outer membrane lipoprotein carrier protein
LPDARAWSRAWSIARPRPAMVALDCGTMITHMLVCLLAAGGTGAPAATSSNHSKSPVQVVSKAAPELRTVLERMQKRYDQAKDLRARFSQTYRRAVVGRVTVSTGTLAFKKPGRMRWDYEQPEPRMFLSDGKILWMYEPTEKQAFKQDLKASQLPAALAFLMGKGKITDQFEVTFAAQAKDAKEKLPGRPEDIRLALSPKQPQSTYKSILFVVDPKEYLVRESVLVDAQGNSNHFVFEDLVVNGKVSDASFKWSPPAGVRVVDTNRMGK